MTTVPTKPGSTALRATRGGLIAEADWRPLGIDDLEPAAWVALKDPHSTAVIAGPGAGKTEFLAQRAAFLLQTGRCPSPQQILAISYKRSSAANLAQRVTGRVPELASRLASMTFDSFTKGLVDRFGSALPTPWALNGPYEITVWKDWEISDFLNTAAANAPSSLASGIRALRPSRFLPDVAGRWDIPADPSIAPVTAAGYAAWSWWRERYLRPGAQYIEFTMLNRLAALAVRSSDQLRRALQLTYPFVFVDEFQDTTAAQLSLLQSLFRGSAVVTAVGDRKQRIMGFAGALEHAIDLFGESFDANPHHLSWNFRSSSELVELQHVIARVLDPDVVQAVSKAKVEEGHIAASIWRFSSAHTEATYIANWIAEDIGASARAASDFVLVAKQKVATLENELAVALAARGLAVRNDDAFYGKTRLQDLLAHELTRLLVGVLRLAAEPAGLGKVWATTAAILGEIRGGSDDDVTERQLSDELSRFTAHLRSWLADNDISETDPAEVIIHAAAVATDAQLRAFVAGARRGEDADVLRDSLTRRLARVIPDAGSWRQAFADIDAEDAVSLMTVHRSKGLEYHTVFFLGLDDDQWWSHTRDPEGSTSTFFVGLSRAAQRLIFTSTATGARDGQITDLYALLDAAGVSETYLG